MCRIILILLFFISFVFVSCSKHIETSVVTTNDGGTIEKKVKLGNLTVEKLEVEWKNEYIIATGYAPIVKKYGDLARDKELARRGAGLDAQRNLAKMISKVKISETVTMADLQTTDFVQSQLDAILQNVEFLNERYDQENERWEVTARIPKLTLLNIVEYYK